MSKILCDRCSYYMHEYFCDDCEQGYYKFASDHVSKKALREWCEGYLESTKKSTALHEICTGNFVRQLLDQFCKEGE